MKNENNKRKKGFTMIELLVVALILCVIAGIALPVYYRAVEKSRASGTIQMLGNIAKAEQRYKLQNSGDFTDNINALDITMRAHTPANVTDSTFDTEYFDFTLGTEAAQAAQKNGVINCL